MEALTLFTILGCIISFFLFHWLIASATESKIKLRNQEKEIKLLRLIARKMNATEDVNWLDSPSVLNSSVERLKAIKAIGLDAALDFHGRLHKPMAKQLAKALEPHRPLFLEENTLGHLIVQWAGRSQRRGPEIASSTVFQEEASNTNNIFSPAQS